MRAEILVAGGDALVRRRAVDRLVGPVVARAHEEERRRLRDGLVLALAERIEPIGRDLGHALIVGAARVDLALVRRAERDDGARHGLAGGERRHPHEAPRAARLGRDAEVGDAHQGLPHVRLAGDGRRDEGRSPPRLAEQRVEIDAPHGAHVLRRARRHERRVATWFRARKSAEARPGEPRERLRPPRAGSSRSR